MENRDKLGRFIKGSKGHSMSHSEKTKNKISLSKKGQLLGKNNPAKRLEVKKKISKGKKGKPLSKNHANKIRMLRLGIKDTLKARKNKSLAQIKRWNKTERQKVTYKTIRSRIQFRLWRESVFARDNYTCQKCWIKGIYLHPHHIKNFAEYPKLRFAIDNGITFCKKCHNKFHKKYGYRNNTKEQVNMFIKEKK